jgi:hypothetical protein
MPQTSMIRCTMGAALLSSVVGGLAYGTAKRECDTKEMEFRSVAEAECMANDPSVILNEEPKTEQDAINQVRRLQALHDVCTYGMTGQGNTHG